MIHATNYDIENPPAPEGKETADWRVNLFGPYIKKNNASDKDNENSVQVLTEISLDATKYKYIGVFFGADYCPHCKLFAPKLMDSHKKLLDKKCKVILASNDRTEEAFNATLRKVAGIDAIPYDTTRTRKMRDLFDLKTIPAFVILRNSEFQKETPPMITVDGRDQIVKDPDADQFPWPWARDKSTEDKTEAPVISGWDRFIIHGKYGKWWHLGHKANLLRPDTMYMDEHAVRIRAGLLNIVTWLALMNVFFWREQLFIKVLWPFVAWEFLASGLIGLTPLAPFGTVGVLMAMLLHPEPKWKPANPKRFAWAIGLTLAVMCFSFVMAGPERLGGAYKPLIAATVLTCNVFTWLESSCGFCFGCFVYNNYLVPMFNYEECSECKI